MKITSRLELTVRELKQIIADLESDIAIQGAIVSELVSIQNTVIDGLQIMRAVLDLTDDCSEIGPALLVTVREMLHELGEPE